MGHPEDEVKKKAKKRRLEPPNVTQGNAPKKRKRRHADPLHVDNLDASPMEGRTSKKNSYSKVISLDPPAKSTVEERREDVEASGDVAPSSPKKKKGSKSSQRPKSRKNKADFPNPEVDDALDPQAAKALAYAFTQFSDPSAWKFNKAKQNWLLRNVWSIPDIYFPLTIKYLAQLQGGSRDKLRETCTTALTKSAPGAEPTKPTEPSETELPTESGEAPPKPKSILKSTTSHAVAGPIIPAALETPNAPVVDVKKRRAQLLLDALAESS